jgi:ELWxxDGT repeat protein
MMAGSTRTLIPLCGLLAVLLAGAAAAVEDKFAGPAFLVRNIDDGADPKESSRPRDFVAAGDLVFFTADDGEHGRELWRTDGTPGGTILLRDIAPGMEDGVYAAPVPFENLVAFRSPVPFGNLVAFRVSGGSLWRSDGTRDGTFALLEQSPGSMIAIGERLFFATEEWESDTRLGHVLWTSDGSRDGTVPLRRFTRTDEFIDSFQLYAASDRLYAVIWAESVARAKIWAADARSLVNTGEGIRSATPIELPLVLLPDVEKAGAGDILLFAASDTENVSLWRSDGTTAGTFPLLQGAGRRGPFYLDDRSVAQPHFTQDGQRVYFIGTDGVHGLEPWVTDGTVDGTRMVADLVAGSVGVSPCTDALDWMCERDLGGLPLVSLIPRENDLMIGRAHYSKGIGTVSDLWISGGTAAGTRRIEAAVPGSYFTSRDFTGQDQSLLFQAQQGDDHAIWHGDGTLTGSRRVAAVNASNIVDAANGFIFIGWDPEGVEAEPWWSDGTPEGTYLLRDIRRGDASSTPRDLTELNGILLFSAATAEHGRELWRSDATSDGTILVADIWPGPDGATVAEITRLGDVVLFAADDGVHGPELWSSDGTAAGTAMVRDIQRGAAGAHPNRLAVVDGLLYFYADDGVHGVELWSSDGTAAGTRLLADVNPHGDGGERIGDTIHWGAQDRYIAGLDGTVYFVADDGTHGAELWRSDGAGSADLVADIRSGAASSWPHSLVAASGAIYFNVHLNDLSDRFNNLWRSDGSESGTGPAMAPPFEVETAAYRIDESVVFLSRSPDGNYLTSVDLFNRATSTALLDFYWFQRPIGAADSIFLASTKGLWRSDVGVLDSFDHHVGRYTSFSEVGGKLVIAVRGRGWGDELEEIRTSNGAPNGTVRLQYLRRSKHTYNNYEYPPQLEFVAAGDHAFFSADVGDTGHELWAVPLSALPDVQPLATLTATVPPGGDATPTATAPPVGDVTPTATVPSVGDATPTATVPPVGDATPTPMASATDTATATPTATAPCILEGDPPGCARIEVDDLTATAGATASIAAHLRSLGEPIAALQVDLTFDPRMRVIAEANGSPRCRVDAGLGKDSTVFAFAPASCDAGGADCATVRALVLSITNLDPIADGSTLFSCDVRIAEDAPPATYPVTASEASAASSQGRTIEIGARNGSIAVVRRVASTLDPATSSSGSCAIDPQPTRGIVPVAAALLAIIIARRGRRSRSNSRRVRPELAYLLPHTPQCAPRIKTCSFGRALSTPTPATKPSVTNAQSVLQ